MEPLLCCFPNRPEPLIAQIITCYMSFGTPQEDSKRSIAHALRMLLSFHCPLREMSLLLLGGSLLFADKTVRSYAAELWVEGLTAGRINNRRVGEILARLCLHGTCTTETLHHTSVRKHVQAKQLPQPPTGRTAHRIYLWIARQTRHRTQTATRTPSGTAHQQPQ